MSSSITVHLTRSPKPRPCPFRTAPMFSMVCLAWASIPAGSLPSAPMPSCPERKSRSPTRTALENGSRCSPSMGVPICSTGGRLAWVDASLAIIAKTPAAIAFMSPPIGSRIAFSAWDQQPAFSDHPEDRAELEDGKGREQGERRNPFDVAEVSQGCPTAEEHQRDVHRKRRRLPAQRLVELIDPPARPEVERDEPGKADGADAGGNVAGQAPWRERQGDEQHSHEKAAERGRTDLRPLFDELIGVLDVQELGSGA